MNWMDQAKGQSRLFRVRPTFLMACATVVAVLILPDVVAQSHVLKSIVLLLAALAILAGWFLLLRDDEQRQHGDH